MWGAVCQGAGAVPKQALGDIGHKLGVASHPTPPRHLYTTASVFNKPWGHITMKHLKKACRRRDRASWVLNFAVSMWEH